MDRTILEFCKRGFTARFCRTVQINVGIDVRALTGAAETRPEGGDRAETDIPGPELDSASLHLDPAPPGQIGPARTIETVAGFVGYGGALEPAHAR